MGTRTVRLDEQAERALSEVRQHTGLNVGEALRKGLFLLREQVRKDASAKPYEVYRSLELGPGDESAPPARRAKETAGAAIRRKWKR